MEHSSQKTNSYTPGPWEVKKLRDEGIGARGHHFEILHPLINESGEYKGQVGGYHIVLGETIGSKISEADIRVMSAAPEMLNALREIVRSYEDRGMRQITEGDIGRAERAIAKAEGKD